MPFAHLDAQTLNPELTARSRNRWRFCCLASWLLIGALLVLSGYGSRNVEIGQGGTAARYKRGITDGWRSDYEELRVIDGEWHVRTLGNGPWKRIAFRDDSADE